MPVRELFENLDEKLDCVRRSTRLYGLSQSVRQTLSELRCFHGLRQTFTYHTDMSGSSSRLMKEGRTHGGKSYTFRILMTVEVFMELIQNADMWCFKEKTQIWTVLRNCSFGNAEVWHVDKHIKKDDFKVQKWSFWGYP